MKSFFDFDFMQTICPCPRSISIHKTSNIKCPDDKTFIWNLFDKKIPIISDWQPEKSLPSKPKLFIKIVLPPKNDEKIAQDTKQILKKKFPILCK